MGHRMAVTRNAKNDSNQKQQQPETPETTAQGSQHVTIVVTCNGKGERQCCFDVKIGEDRLPFIEENGGIRESLKKREIKY